MMLRGIPLLIPFLLLSCTAADSPPSAADLLLTNGRVYTLDWADPDTEGGPAPDAPYDAEGGWHPDAQAIAVRDGEIVFVGSSPEAETFRGPDTDVLDLKGATVIPGLIESHVHLVQLGEFLSQVDLVDVDTEEEAVRLAAERAAQSPPGTWILGSGWDEGAWANRYPTVELLSERVPDHPVYLRGLHGFAGWGNRMAFELAGITSDTPDPVGGQLVRDAEGNPSGVLLNRAILLLEEHIPVPSLEETMGHVLAGLEVMAESGFTSIHEAGSNRRYQEAFEQLEAEGRLPLRVYSMLAARDPDLCEEWLIKGPDTDTESMLRTRSVKAFYDAALGSRGARMIDDYSDMPGHRGVSGSDYGFDQELVARMMAAGFQAEIHAIGDAGNRETLDFLERVLSQSPEARPLRNKIVHAQVVHPDDFQRFADLGVAASMQPPHVAEDMDWAEDRVGPDRINGAYAWRTMRRTGVRLLLNSDLPGSDWDIFYGLHAAITRRDKELQPSSGWYPDQRLTPEEAIRGYTTWGAWAEFLDEVTGVIRLGMRGDLTVMNLDPFVVGSTEPGRLLEGQILVTVVGGKVVYEAGRQP
ncbi:MAG: amidohydrolase [Longimicrobiales bacterium]|nr:amidohydrolase [Longimicrobiales bacterium]